MGRTSTGCPAGHRPYSWHTERSGHSHCLHARWWFDTLSCPRDINWTPGPSTAKSLCASTVAFRPGSHVSDSESTPSMIVSTWNNASTTSTCSDIQIKLDDPIDLTEHILSPFFVRDLHYQGCRFHSIAHLMCYRYAAIHGLRLFSTSIRKWARHLTEFPTSRFQTPDWQVVCRTVLTEIYGHLCINDMAVKHLLTRAHGLSLYTARRRGGHCVILHILFCAGTFSVTFWSTHVYTWPRESWHQLNGWHLELRAVA